MGAFASKARADHTEPVQMIALFEQSRHHPLMPRTDFARYALYGESPSAVPAEFLHIEDIPSRARLYDWVIAPHIHKGILQLLLIVEGSARVTIDGDELEARAPALALVPAGSVHAFRFAADTRGWVVSLAMDLLSDPRLAPYVDRLHLTTPTGSILDLAALPRDAVRLDWLFGDMAERLAQAPALVPDIAVAMLAVCLSIAEGAGAGGRGPAERHGGSGQLVRAFLAQVERNFARHWPVSTYADALATTAATLTRACRKETGLAPAALIHDRLLLEARRYLRHTGASSRQISERLGFADPAYFARFFKARTGQTASAWRMKGD
jgi:AraC family transcriptional activator of pobA